MVDTIVNPIAIVVKSIKLKKPLGQSEIDINPQFRELTLYTSIFQPSIRADLLLYDPIGLFFNYPLLGEETIEITFSPTQDPQTGSDLSHSGGSTVQDEVIKFAVNSVRAITPKETIRATAYVVELYSIEIRVNARKRLQKAYNDQYHNVIKKILEDELQVDQKKLRGFQNANNAVNPHMVEASLGTYHFVVPNLKPLEACSWINKRALPLNNKNKTYLFFETLEGYNFISFEQLMENASHGTINKYTFVSNINDGIMKQVLKQLKVPEHNLILSLHVGKRWNTNEKIVGGYFENEYLDIDIFNRVVHQKQHLLSVKETEGCAMNTDRFVEINQTHDPRPGSLTRVRYSVSQDQGDQANQRNYWEDKFGPSTEVIAGLAQVGLTVAVAGDTRVNVGQVIEVIMPEIHGFTGQVEDQLISGKYMITEMKQTIKHGMNHMMTLNLHRNTYEHNPNFKMKYNTH